MELQDFCIRQKIIGVESEKVLKKHERLQKAIEIVEVPKRRERPKKLVDTTVSSSFSKLEK